MADKFSLKDELFNADTVSYLAGLFVAADDRFDGARFQRDIMGSMLSLELKDRISLITDVLAQHLPDDFDQAAERIHAALPPPLDPTKTDNDFGRFIMAPLGEFTARYGLEHREAAMRLLKALTMRFSMEFAIRHFINRWPEETLADLTLWARDDNYHVRRLVSEGTRPRLPWGKNIVVGIKAPLPLLDTLHADRTRYVTRSVANHLNDIAKHEPDLVFETLRRWRSEGQQKAPELDWMTRHALRSLVKQGHKGALDLLGYRRDAAVDVALTVRTQTVRFGGALEFDVDLAARNDEALLIDYVVDFVKANGTTAPKVFKLKTLNIGAGDRTQLSKRHVLRANATTFRLFAGTHRVSLQVNGVIRATGQFDLIEA